MKTICCVRATCVALIVLGVLRTNPARAQLLYDNGSPDFLSGNLMTEAIQAEDFTLSSAASVGIVQFWDGERPGAFQGSFVWQIYSNGAGNQPGTLLFSGTSLNLSHQATGRTAPGVNVAEFLDTFEIGSISLLPGTYWLALHNGPLSLTTTGDANMAWERTPSNGRAGGWEDIAPFGDGFTPNFQEHAFRLYGPGSAVPTVPESNATLPLLLVSLGLLRLIFGEAGPAGRRFGSSGA